jgi:hypothetical protein
MAKRVNAQQMSLNPKNEQADGVFVEEYLRKFTEGDVVKVKKTLYVHN